MLLKLCSLNIRKSVLLVYCGYNIYLAGVSISVIISTPNMSRLRSELTTFLTRELNHICIDNW